MVVKFKHWIGENTEVVVCCDYDPPQKQILYPNEKAQPGYEAKIEVTEVFIGDDDVYGCLTEECIGGLCDAAWDNLPEEE
jgi:hypothetical protein